MAHHPYQLSAAELARRMRAGTLSPIDVIEAHITRIQASHAAINALVTPTFDQARGEARAAAEALARGQAIGPLHGVPFVAKDCLDVAGVRSTCGLTARRDHVPAADATVVARMRAAGAILLGKTNTPDNCFDQETDNLLFGRTNNPWDVARTVGGSSGGDAALLAAGGAPLGIGTDIAGSIRMPAHFTGIVGLRPTSATLSEQGNWPPAAHRLADLEAIGPLARTVADAALAYDVMAGAPHLPPDPGLLRGEPLVCWLSDGLLPASRAVQAAVLAAGRALEAAGMRRLPTPTPLARLATVGWLAYLGPAERAAIEAGFGGGARWRMLGELRRALLGRPRVAAGALRYWVAAELGSRLLNALRVDGAAWRERLRARLAELIGERGVAVSPIFPTSAPRHGWSGWALFLAMGYQTWVNLAGLPGLTVPVGRSGNGMPVGVQIVGAPGAERTILAAGLAIERAVEASLQRRADKLIHS